MRFSFAAIALIAATFTSAVIVPRNGNISRMDISKFQVGESSGRRSVEGNQGRSHPREFHISGRERSQRRSDGTSPRTHPRDFPRREQRAAEEEDSEESTLHRRHPRDFRRRERNSDDGPEIRAFLSGRWHAHQLRSLN
ncbi:hypothetical protein C8J57DRAFT_1288349 [Mycena rebaudengoi]|nr:hypothetical protein C8J57DRAFT_1403759 [Mycena rebaudengoi]KAJ7284397.1 hypothetical protein C8J57DRAFT_1288349 [Mycena rebaudengoi]